MNDTETLQPNENEVIVVEEESQVAEQEFLEKM